MRFLKMILLLVIVITFLLLFNLMPIKKAPVEKAGRYFYGNPFDSTKFLAIRPDLEEVALGDLAYQAIFCEDNHPYICFSSKPISFAIPRVPHHLTDHWEWNGVKYRLVKTKLVWLIGQEYSVYQVASEQQGIEFNFLYSYKAGLIGFQGTEGKSVGHFLMTNKTGFGSTK